MPSLPWGQLLPQQTIRVSRQKLLLSTWDLPLWHLILSIVFGGNRNRSSPAQQHPNSEASGEGTIRTYFGVFFPVFFLFKDREAGQASVNAGWSVIQGRYRRGIWSKALRHCLKTSNKTVTLMTRPRQHRRDQLWGSALWLAGWKKALTAYMSNITEANDPLNGMHGTYFISSEQWGQIDLNSGINATQREKSEWAIKDDIPLIHLSSLAHKRRAKLKAVSWKPCTAQTRPCRQKISTMTMHMIKI